MTILTLGAILVIAWYSLNTVHCESPPEPPFPVSVAPCGQLGGQCRIFSSPCPVGEVEGSGTCNRMSKCCLEEAQRCKSSNGGKCIKEGNWMKCKGIIDKDYTCPRRRICCLQGTTIKCPEVLCPMDCAVELYKDNNGCDVCRCKPGSGNPWE